MTLFSDTPENFSPEKLMKGIAVHNTQSDVDRVLAYRAKLRTRLGTPEAHHDIKAHIRDADAALRTYRKRLAEARVAAGFDPEALT